MKNIVQELLIIESELGIVDFIKNQYYSAYKKVFGNDEYNNNKRNLYLYYLKNHFRTILNTQYLYLKREKIILFYEHIITLLGEDVNDKTILLNKQIYDTYKDLINIKLSKLNVKNIFGILNKIGANISENHADNDPDSYFRDYIPKYLENEFLYPFIDQYHKML